MPVGHSRFILFIKNSDHLITKIFLLQHSFIFFYRFNVWKHQMIEWILVEENEKVNNGY